MSVDQVPLSIATVVLSTNDLNALKAFVANGPVRYLSFGKTKWFQVMKSTLNQLYSSVGTKGPLNPKATTALKQL